MPTAYLGLEASLHDALWAAEGDPAELPLLADFLHRHPGRALEIGCGSGRLLLPLLARGFDIDGLDNSPDMLALCREHAARQGLVPVLHAGDMNAFTRPEPYASLVIPAFTLQLAPDPATPIARFADILTPGGALYLTTFLPLAELTGELPEDTWFPDHAITLPDGRRATVATRHRIDRPARRLVRHHRYELFASNGTLLARHRSTHRLRWFDPGELDALLAGAGFTVTSRIAGFDPAADPDDDPQILTLHARLPCAPDGCRQFRSLA